MGEHSPKRHDIAQFKFLCETLYHDYLANLEENNHGQVNDPTLVISFQLNELIEHIVAFALNYKVEYNENNKFIEQIGEYLDGTLMLFSSYGINIQGLQKWREPGNRLFRCLVNATRENPASLPYQNYYNHGQRYARRTFNENRLFDVFTSLSDNWHAGTCCREK